MLSEVKNYIKDRLFQRQVPASRRPPAQHAGQRRPGPDLLPVHDAPRRAGAVPEDQVSQVP